MHFIVYCLDHPDIAERRQAVHDAHTAWLRSSPLRTLVSGPLTDLDGKANGSFFLYEDNDIGRVREVVAEAPFNKAGVWRTVDIRPFLKRVDNR